LSAPSPSLSAYYPCYSCDSWSPLRDDRIVVLVKLKKCFPVLWKLREKNHGATCNSQLGGRWYPLKLSMKYWLDFLQRIIHF
jgi:hypothetical protein